MSLEDDHDERARMRRPAAGPWGSPAPELPDSPAPQVGQAISNNRVRFSSIAFFVLMVLLIGARAYNDLSRPEAWAYWKDLYFSPGMASSRIANADPDGSGRRRPGLAISGTIGAATASWFRDRLDEAHLVAGDAILLSSPGEGSMLGVHRFVTSAPGHDPDPVAETQRTAGMVLSYMTKMGVSSAVVEAMSQTKEVRWLGAKEASAMNLITDPIGAP